MSSFKKFILISSSVLLLGWFVLPEISQAVDMASQLNAAAGESGAGFSAEVKDPRLVVAHFIKISLTLLGIIFLGLMVYAGFSIFMSRGEEDKIEEGKKTIRRAIIGILVILSAYSLTLLAETIATGDRKHQGDYIEMKPENDFQGSPYHDVDRFTCPDGLVRQPNGDCGAYETGD